MTRATARPRTLPLLALASTTLVACSLLVDVPDLSANHGVAASPEAGSAPDAADAPDATGAEAGAPDYRAEVLAAAPLVYLRLGDRAGASQARDERGGAPFALVGAVGLGSPGLVTGTDTAASLDGASAGLRLGTGPDFAGREAFSFELWLVVRSLDAQNRMLFLKDGESGGRQAVGAFFDAERGVTFERWVAGAALAAHAPIEVGAPHHLVLTFDGSALRIFLDGAERASTGDTRAQAAKVSPMSIGYDPSGGGKGFFGGVLDEVAIYPRALTPDEIARHHAAGRGGR